MHLLNALLASCRDAASLCGGSDKGTSVEELPASCLPALCYLFALFGLNTQVPLHQLLFPVSIAVCLFIRAAFKAQSINKLCRKYFPNLAQGIVQQCIDARVVPESIQHKVQYAMTEGWGQSGRLTEEWAVE